MGSSQLSVTTVQRAPTYSSGLCRHQKGKTTTQIQNKTKQNIRTKEASSQPPRYLRASPESWGGTAISLSSCCSCRQSLLKIQVQQSQNAKHTEDKWRAVLSGGLLSNTPEYWGKGPVPFHLPPSLFCLFWDKIPRFRPGCPGTCYIDLAGLTLSEFLPQHFKCLDYR